MPDVAHAAVPRRPSVDALGRHGGHVPLAGDFPFDMAVGDRWWRKKQARHRPMWTES